MVVLSARVWVAVALLVAGCRWHFDDTDHSAVEAGVPDDDALVALGVRLADHVQSAQTTSVTTNATTIAAGSTLVVVMWGSSNIATATASDPIAGAYTSNPILSKASSFATQDVWVVENHPGGNIAVTLSWPMSQVVTLFVVEVMNVRSFETAASAQSNGGPVFSSPNVTTTTANDVLLSFDLTNGAAGELVTFTSGEAELGHSTDPTSYPGAIGARRVDIAGTFHTTATQATGSSGLMSVLAFAGQ